MDLGRFTSYCRCHVMRLTASMAALLSRSSMSVQTVLLFFAGLARLENLYSVVNKQHISMVIDAVRLADVSYSYMTLRQIDASRSHGNKYIVLDLSTEDAVQSVLKQVSYRQDYNL